MRDLPTAIAFLTRIPVPLSWTGGADVVGRSARYFPLVGLLLGAAYWFVARYSPLNVMLTTVVVLIADALLTGALHLDGLSDMADGFGGGHTREDVLRIMRDHQIGAYGAVALLLMLLLKAAAITELIHAGRMPVLLLAPCAARWATVWMSYMGPYARPAGTGAVSRFVGRTELATASVIVLGAAYLIRSWTGWLLCVPAVATAAFLLAWSRLKIGGVTGDVIGAATAVSETLILVTATKLW